ncbi:DUF6011 domain-containing protein [Streptomyces cyaneofuscatus]|uniref:DUF6011 domain-containing protein n=1 Tax=Streptomyces cyaneofuscatus TaxID=66883 RepID=UPI0033A67163
MSEARRCTVCGRPLRDPVSRARGTGPVCARKLRELSRQARRQLLPVDDVPTGPYL